MKIYADHILSLNRLRFGGGDFLIECYVGPVGFYRGLIIMLYDFTLLVRRKQWVLMPVQYYNEVEQFEKEFAEITGFTLHLGKQLYDHKFVIVEP